MNRISVTGSHVPKLILEFDELRTSYQVPINLLKNMKDSGYILPTPIQMQAMPIMLEVKKRLYNKIGIILQIFQYFFSLLIIGQTNTGLCSNRIRENCDISITYHS